MRIPKTLEETKSQPQQELFEEDPYTYRIFCTNLDGKAQGRLSRQNNYITLYRHYNALKKG